MGKLKLMTVIGTRPEIIRLSATIQCCDRYFEQTLVHTGQNYDYELNQVFFEDLGLRAPDYYLNAAGANLGETIGTIIAKSYALMQELKPDAVLVLGDTNSCLSVIAAKRLHIPIFHMEAGNRCFDECLPEETNRRIVDVTSDVNLCYSEHARRYLNASGVPKERTFVVGSPMAEVLHKNLPQIEASDILARLGLQKEKYILLSAHREENIDTEENFRALFTAINAMAAQYDMPVLYSCHPRSRKRLEESGFELDPGEVNPGLKPHQRDAVVWALRGGRRALFESFGLGKTVQEIEFCHQAVRHDGGRALIVLPLGVRQEFARDAQKILGYPAPVYITSMEDLAETDAEIVMTNYERVRDGDIDPTCFTAVALDEASVLRSFGSKTYQTFLPKFRGVKYKLVSTATPSPNRYKELIHYAGYLEIMDTGQALTRFFQRDSTKANNLTLYPHKEDEFWLWVSSWALFIGRPSDLGYDDTGYDLPPLEVRTHVVRDDYGKEMDRDGQYKLTNDAAVSLVDASREKRESIEARVAVAREIVESDPEAHFLLWHDLEAERHALLRALPGAVDIYGSMDYTERERRVIDFSEGRTRLFATKKSLSGSGCNFQRHCHRAIFVGIDYEFNDFIQAIHRIYRFLQAVPVVIDIIYTEAEDPIYRVLLEKWKQHNAMQERMREIVQKYGLSGAAQTERMSRSIGVERVEVKGKNFTAVNNDCVEEVGHMAENSVDLIVTSIPFSNHYEYTPSYNDFGHNEDTRRFFEQMDYLSPN